MKLKYTTSRFPKGIASKDIKLTPGSKLAARVVIFKNITDLRRQVKNVFGIELGNSCYAAVIDLADIVEDGQTGKKVLQCDPKYYCFIGFAQNKLSIEYVCHECVHAGYAYEKRVKRDIWAPINSIDEERVAYPAGMLARNIMAWIWKNKLHEKPNNLPRHRRSAE